MDLARKVVLVLCVLLLSSCASYSVSYLTEPFGATVVHKQANPIGVGPVRMEYGRDQQYTDSNGCFQVPGVVATWPSGATV